MNVFLAAVRLDGRAINRREPFTSFRRLPGLTWDSDTTGAFAGYVMPGTLSARPLQARFNGLVGVGDVRLDNHGEIRALVRTSIPGASDLELVLAAIEQHGPDVVARLHGDFAFVAFDARAQKVVAARDVFGVKPLYYRRTAEHMLFSSRLEPLAGEERHDAEYVADFLIGLPGNESRTIWQDTHQLEPGVLLIQRGSVATQQRYWDAGGFEPDATISEREAVQRWRELFEDAVRTRLMPGATWAQLSGGLDSSSVVCMASELSKRTACGGVAGTVTVVDSLGTGDERRYSDAVLARCGVRNEQIVDYWPWRNDIGTEPVAPDAPSPLFPFYARDEHTVDTVVRGGGKVLLSGLGSDHYMFGTLTYMADLLARGAVRDSAREVLGWALRTRRSFWHTARENVVAPLWRNVAPPSKSAVPRWLNHSFVQRTNVIEKAAVMYNPRAPLGRFYETHTAVELARVANWVQRGPFEERLEMRYPFLSRALVEFTLRLPVRLKIRPEGRKWVLREAMREILPETVRTRAAKGGIDARILWAFERERVLIDKLLANPRLCELGYVDAAALRTSVDAARRGAWHHTVHVLSVLALESWLRARDHQWPQQRPSQSAA